MPVLYTTLPVSYDTTANILHTHARSSLNQQIPASLEEEEVGCPLSVVLLWTGRHCTELCQQLSSLSDRTGQALSAWPGQAEAPKEKEKGKNNKARAEALTVRDGECHCVLEPLCYSTMCFFLWLRDWLARACPLVSCRH